MTLVNRIASAAKRGILNIKENPAIIFLYHRVTNLTSDPQQLAVNPENFILQLRFLKKNYNVLSIEEFLYYKQQAKKFPRGSVLITFDDGYADNFLEALPILEYLNIQSLFYVTTSNIDTNRELWWDELERILFEAGKLPSILKLNINNNSYEFRTGTIQERQVAYRALHPLIKFNSSIIRESILAELRSWGEVEEAGRSTHRLMKTEEIKKMALSTSTVLGAHTHTHAPLSVLNYTEQYEEISKSKNILENITGKKIQHFSYPFGGHEDYNSESIKAAANLDFKMVCSNYYGHVHKDTDIFQLPRILVRDWPIGLFKIKVKKFFIF